jgi:hypothetical protein
MVCFMILEPRFLQLYARAVYAHLWYPTPFGTRAGKPSSNTVIGMDKLKGGGSGSAILHGLSGS